MKRLRTKALRRAGFTLVEVVIASVVLVALWYGLADAMRSGARSQQVLMDAAGEVGEIRRSNGELLDDLRATSAAAMSVELEADGNCVLELQHPIRFEGADTWGVSTPGHAFDAPTTGEPGWRIRYSVSGTTLQSAPRSLVRQVLDADEEVRDERVIVTELAQGDTAHPSFSVTQEGELWKVHISQANHDDGPDGPGTEFHVRMRN